MKPSLSVSDYCLHELFQDIAHNSPDDAALIFEGAVTTYHQLNVRSNQVARHLRAIRLGAEEPVGICLPLSPDAIACVLGVLKAGGAYVPLDPAHPPIRIQGIIRDAHISTIITTSEIQERLTPDAASHRFVNPRIDCTDEEANTDLPTITTPDYAAYIMYTSGSEGTPKGVILNHRSVTNGLAAVPFHGRDDEICSLNTSLAVGFTVSRLFLPLLSGIPLVVIPDGKSKHPEWLVDALTEGQVTSVAFVTDFLREILSSVGSLASRLKLVRSVTVGGSAVTPDLIAAFQRELPHATLINGYAATEIGGAALVWVSSGGYPSSRVSPGRPFPNTDIYILTDTMEPVANGTAGEIYVGARHLARGYLDNPRLTAERFLPNPFSDRPGGRMYRTGDVGRKSEDGQIELLGRVDHQIKIRGYRVEIAEIEKALLGYHGVRECVVILDPDSQDIRLLAYIVAQYETNVTVLALTRWLRARLPLYMIPPSYVFLEQLPRTPAGKIDRQALPHCNSTYRPDLCIEYVEPRNVTETGITEIWMEILGLDRIGIYDEFLDLGGHSILAVQIALAIEERLGLELPPQWFLETPTIAQIVTAYTTEMRSDI